MSWDTVLNSRCNHTTGQPPSPKTTRDTAVQRDGSGETKFPPTHTSLKGPWWEAQTCGTSSTTLAATSTKMSPRLPATRGSWELSSRCPKQAKRPSIPTPCSLQSLPSSPLLPPFHRGHPDIAAQDRNSHNHLLRTDGDIFPVAASITFCLYFRISLPNK